MREPTTIPARGPVRARRLVATRRPGSLSSWPPTRRRGGTPSPRQRPARCRARAGDEPASGPPMESTRGRWCPLPPRPRAQARRAGSPSPRAPGPTEACQQRGPHGIRARPAPVLASHHQALEPRVARRQPGVTQGDTASAATRASAQKDAAAWHRDGSAHRPRASVRQSVRPETLRSVGPRHVPDAHAQAPPAARCQRWHMRCTRLAGCGHRRVRR